MSRSDALRLADIIEQCEFVVELTSRSRSEFDHDSAVRPAIERGLEIIGEAANALSGETRDRFPNAAWPDIRRLRVVLAHHYHRVDPDQVWTIATTSVPELLKTLTGHGPPN